MFKSLPCVALALASTSCWSQAMPADAAGAKDHALLSRYAGSWLVAQDIKDFDEISLPAGAKPAEVVKLEGRITRLYYLAPAGKSPLEVQRNYEQALEKAGATRRDDCVEAACRGRGFASARGNLNALKPAAGKLDGWDAVTMTQQWQYADTERWWHGTIKSPAGAPIHVAVLSAKQGLVAFADKHVATVVAIVEPKAMDGGKVTVDASALAKGLQTEGRIALYGVFFDSGKAELKPESKPQLDEMAKLLQAQPALKVHIVGHTDNEGALDANLALSKARAQAVVEQLVKAHKIDAKRLTSAGVASYAPVAGNGTDAGRARNRRVELVQQ